MKKFNWLIYSVFLMLFIRCNNTPQQAVAVDIDKSNDSLVDQRGTSEEDDVFIIKKKLPQVLRENSGIVADGNYIWAVTDTRVPFIFKLDLKGNLVQTVEISGAKMKDVEAITVDAEFLYIGDIGDNDGVREKRTIYKIKKSNIGAGNRVKVKAEKIHFSFKGFEEAKKKKHNEYDAEAMISIDNSLYIFTKRRTDEKTELFSVPKTAGEHTAKSIVTYNSNGMITGAGINNNGSEIALIGYNSGHYNSFIILLSNFTALDVFNGNQQRIELTSSKIDWQTEGITFMNNDLIYFSCETTPAISATIYAVTRSNLERVKNEKIK